MSRGNFKFASERPRLQVGQATQHNLKRNLNSESEDSES
jgi:hypothetical protein